MLTHAKACSGLAVHDLQEAQRFCSKTLGLRTSEEYGLRWLHLAGGRETLVYEQPEAVPASFTILNFEVDDIDATVHALSARGVRFERRNSLALAGLATRSGTSKTRIPAASPNWKPVAISCHGPGSPRT